MKITDLMIGDFFSFNGNKYKIEDIKKCGAIHIEYYPEGGRVELNSDFILEDLNPIPLTYKILEKNGFSGEAYMTLDLDDSSYLEYYGFEGRLRKIWNGVDEWNNHSADRDITFQCHCKYVHELQHALRWCGLDELADKFKI